MHTWIHPHHSTPFLSDYKFYTLFIHPITQNEKHSHHSPNEQHSFLKTQPLRTSYSLFTFLSSNTFYYPFPTILLNLFFIEGEGLKQYNQELSYFSILGP